MLIRSRAARLATLAGAAALLVPLAGCDNPACVFGGDCSPDAQGGAIGTLSAFAPEDGQIVRPGVPVVQRVMPDGPDADPRTPIVIVFSEAMSPATLAFAFELQRVDIGALPLASTALVGDGRVLVLFPLQALQAGDYELRFREDVQVGDRNGQEVVQPVDRVIGSFSVGATPPTLPTMLLSYPDGGEAGLPDTSEIVTVFTRPMDDESFNATSFDVSVGSAPPPFDALPTPVLLQGLSPDTRVFRWISRDDEGERASLGTNVQVTVSLSPAGSSLRDETGNILAPRTFSFTTLPFRAPVAARVTSEPDDAIGVNQLTGPADLAIEVDLVGAQAGDNLGAFVFGTQPEDVMAPLTIALFREVELAASAATFTFTAEELDLVRTSAPLAARVRDGQIEFAFRVRRGNLESPVRRLDVDALTSGAQGPVLDTVAPVLTSVGSEVNPAFEDRSDQRGLSLFGSASEPLRAALVETALGDNSSAPGVAPPVAGANPDTDQFLAAPVPLGLIDAVELPIGYSITIYDRALNSGGTSSGSFRQVGAGAGGFPVPFLSVQVEVFDARTLAPIAGATVWSHEDDLGTVVELGSSVSTSGGLAIVPASPFGPTIVTVDAAGYDLFTFDDVPTDRLGVPLAQTGLLGASVVGDLTTTDANVGVTVRSVGDSRMPRPGEALVSTGPCVLDTQDQQFECGFMAIPVQARQLGALTGISALEPANALLWSAPAFLRGFALRLPLAALEPGQALDVVLPLERLDGLELPAEEVPIDVPPHALSAPNWPMQSGAPRVWVEGLVPGLGTPVVVGRGLAFDTGVPSTWAVRAAYPGQADAILAGVGDQLGRLVLQGTLEPVLYLRADVVATSGARASDRPRLDLSTLALAPPDEPVLAAVPLVPNAGLGFELSFLDVLRDAGGQPGLHRAVIEGTSGRAWQVWRLDAPDAAGPDVVVHLPTLGGTFPLPTGNAEVRTSAWSWPDFDPSSFLWTDVERLAERAAHSAPAIVAIP